MAVGLAVISSTAAARVHKAALGAGAACGAIKCEAHGAKRVGRSGRFGRGGTGPLTRNTPSDSVEPQGRAGGGRTPVVELWLQLPGPAKLLVEFPPSKTEPGSVEGADLLHVGQQPERP